eukprot:Phypoly_transcript_03022.p1 GENE.Phypoly_transcript_03022~~Phypoly_transcript_03022.p1  ORF type:complete len:847 (+),score=257.26 Phypoly_transcript_03022:49-2589(+)
MADGAGRGRGLTVPAWMSSSSAPAQPGGLSNGTAKGNAKDWAEHTAPDGRKYYHNKVTKVTTWEKPNELKNADELATNAGPWKEYTSDTGRKYYFNTITQQTSWELPSDAKASDSGVDSPKGDSTHHPQPTSPAAPSTSSSASTPMDKKDATTAFKELLTQTGVKPTWSWEMTQGQISTDPRYKALKSMGERKQAFAEWCQQRKKQDEEERRRKDRQIKEDYFLMLKDNKDINSKTTWRKAQAAIEGDPRYTAVDEKDRELLFEEFLYEMERREREDAAQARKDAMLKFKKLLEANTSVTVKTQWRKLKDQLADDPTFKALDKLDSLTVFEDHMTDLEHKEEDEARMERERQKRESRKARDAFRELLAEKLDQGDLTLKTKWRDFVKSVKDKEDERYLNMFNTTGSTPHELFCDFLEDLEERMDKDKRVLRDILKDANFTVGLNTTYDEFQTALSSHERYSTIPRTHLKHLFNELMDKAQSKEHSNQKRKKKLISAFKDMLKGFKEITPTSTWIDVRPIVLNQKEFEALDDEQEREKAFTEYTTRLAEKQRIKEEGKDKKDDESESDEDRKHRKKEHKSKSKKHRHRGEDKDRKKKRHAHSSSEDDLPSKKVKKERKEEDTPMDEGDEGERRDRREEGEGERRERRGREEGENGDEKRSVKREEEDEIKKEEDRHIKRDEEGDRHERRRRDEDRGKGRRDDREEEDKTRKRRDDRDDEERGRGRKDDRDEEERGRGRRDDEEEKGRGRRDDRDGEERVRGRWDDRDEEERGRKRRDDRDVRDEEERGRGRRDDKEEGEDRGRGREEEERGRGRVKDERDEERRPLEEKEEGETDDEKKPNVSSSDY